MRYTIWLIALGASLMFGACASSTRDADGAFVSLAGGYVESYLKLNPERATALGDHRYDDRLKDYSAAGVRTALEVNKSYLDSLLQIDPAALSPTNRIDYLILKNHLEGSIYAVETLEEFKWNPLWYNVGGAIYDLIARDFAPLDERLISVRSRLEMVPTVTAMAKANLKNPPRVHTETAIAQNRGTIALVRDDLAALVEGASGAESIIAEARDKAVAALEYYGSWLENDLLPESNGDFRLGEEKFKRKLRYTLDSEIAMEEILRRAQADLADTHERMFETALPLYREFFPDRIPGETPQARKEVVEAVLDKLSESRPTNDTIVDLARKYLADCTRFVTARDLVRVPEEPLELIVMPEFQRGVAVAYCDAPGPLEASKQSFFAISPVPADWTAERAESFFREYNDYMLQDLTIHEAMPGHYLQLAHANEFEAPTLVRAIFSSGPFVEGWATYSEGLMVEAGYGGPEVAMQRLKMRLRMIINAMIDQKIHAGGMTEEEAMALMMNEGFQEEGEAAGKWRRACLTSTQLSTYYVGNLEVTDIRRAYEAREGTGFVYRKFHDELLSYGSPPPRHVRALMGL